MIVLWLGAALAAPGNVYVATTTLAFEDLSPGDADQNDLVLRYNDRCRMELTTHELLGEEIRFTPVAAGAAKTNALWLRFPRVPASVRFDDGGGAVTLCDAGSPCADAVELLADFRDGFVAPPEGFVNTDGAPIATGVPMAIEVVYATGNLPDVGSVVCPDPAFELRRADDSVILDGASTLTNGQPMLGRFPGNWVVPVEHARLDVAYPDFLAWLHDRTDASPCSGTGCAQYDWYLRPGAATVARPALATEAPLAAAATCSDGIVDQDETDTDCGGEVCSVCGVGDGCAIGADCGTGVCGAGFTCAAATCTDGVWNGSETFTDCGGPSCSGCGTGAYCDTISDCANGFCTPGVDGKCGTATCTNGAQKPNGSVVTCVIEGGTTYEVARYGTVGSSWSFNAPASVSSVELLVVAGGGAGGSSSHGLGGGGGGGAGGYVYRPTQAVTPNGAYTVVVGQGGPAAANGKGSNGSNSSFGGALASATGGGAGGAGNSTGVANSGGSGGGAGYNGYGFRAGAAGTPGQGYAGGDNVCSNWAAGGGGAGGVGGFQYSSHSCGTTGGEPVNGGLGGPGVTNDITGVPLVYARGGQGSIGNGNDGAPGAAGTGNGGAGVYANANGGYGGPGGSGVVIVRYPAVP